jgi:multidrug efflux pump subunit AcrA (membrane-fusion protein)
LIVALLAISLIWQISRARRFDLVPLERQTILEAIYGLGKVKALRHYEVKIGVLTTANDVFVVEGQNVKKGDPLIRFESSPFRTPFSGTVTRVEVSPGEVIVPNVPVIRVEDLSDLYLEVALEQQGALRVRAGMPARMTFDTVRGEAYLGKVTSVFSRNDEFLAHIRAEKLPTGILPGMTADVVIEVGARDNALLAPLAAIQEGRILVEREGKRVRIPIEVGIVDGQKAEIVQGELLPTDQVIITKKPAAK